MLVKDTPIGARLVLGEFRDEDMVWVKVSDHNDFVCEKSVIFTTFDDPEPDNPSRARRRFGNAFFPHSGVCQYLNASGYDWWHPQHHYDEPHMMSRIHHVPGFLSSFTDAELAMIEEREVSVAVPLGSRKEFGQVSSMKCRVCLPSASELGCDSDEVSVEGEALPMLRQVLDQPYVNYMTRTGTTDGGHVTSYDNNWFVTVRACARQAVCPMIRIDGNAVVSDGDGDHTLINDDEAERFMELLTA